LRPPGEDGGTAQCPKARQHPVQHQEIGHGLLEAHFPAAAFGDGFHRITGLFKVVAQEFKKRFFVFNDQNVWRYGLLVPF